MGLASARVFFTRCFACLGILALTSLTHVLAVASDSQALGAAQGFNAFVIEDFTSLSSTVEGRLAVGGNLNLQHFSVGDKLDASRVHDVLLVGGNVTFPSGRIYYGNLLAGGSVAGVGNAVLYGMAPGARVKGSQTLPINFSAEHQYLKTLSQNIGNLPTNGKVSLQWGGYYLAGDCSSNLQVFSIDASQLKSVHTFAVSCIPAGATVIFNIMGTSSTIQNVGFQSLTSIRNKVLFNFPQATSVKLTSVGIEGSILAPLAHFENPAGNISGQLIAKSWRSVNSGYISIAHHKFAGDLSAALQDKNVNSKPVITSSPALEVIAGNLFQYQVIAVDPEDQLTYTLPKAPTGMTIDTVTGNIAWSTSANDIGVHAIEVRVTDLESAFDQQVFALTVSAPANQIPEFISTPIILGQENQPYIYQVQAVDPDGDGLTYSLVSSPENMVIDTTSGYISWVPVPGDAGAHNISIQLQDSKGGSAEQSFILTIGPRANQPPQIISTPLTQAAAQNLYLSSIQATDPDQGDTVRFALVTAPEGMIIDATTGELRWSPSMHALGKHAIVISISDNHGLSSTYEFSLTVFKANNPPNITSQPINFVLTGDTWQYTLEAEDPDGDSLAFVMEGYPRGSAFDESSNLVSWPTQGISPGSYTFRFKVADAEGLYVEQSVDVEVLASERRQTHEGTEFWIPVSINAIRATTGGIFEINLVSRTGNTQATITIPSLGINETLPLITNQMSTYSINLDAVAATDAFVLNELIAGHAIHITSGLPVSAYFMNQKNSTTDGFLGLPVASLGKEYIAANYIMLGRLGALKTVDGGQTGPIITLVATENNTEVIIDPVMDILPGGQQHTKAHTPIVVNMNRGDIYNLETRGSFKADLTGSMIKANKLIGVYGQMECVQIPVDSTACDHIVEQLPPIEALATEYYTVPFWGRATSGRFWYQEYGDTFRAVAPHDNTEIYINQTLRARLNRGEYFEFFGKEPQRITSNNPVLLIQYANSNQFDDGYRELPSNYTDPFMVVIPPAAQFLNSYTINTPARDMANNFVNLLVPTSTLATLTVDGLAVDTGSFKAIPDSDFSYAQLPISTGAHHIAAEEPFGIYIYGYDYFESYGYLGGMALSSATTVSSLSLTGAATQSLDNQWCAESLAVDEYERPVHGVRVQFTMGGVTRKDVYQFTNARGVARYCYRANKPGVDVVTATVGELTQSVSVSWFSGLQNLPPVITSLPNLKVVNGSSYSYVVLAQDPEGDGLQYSLLTAPTGMSIDMAGHLVWPKVALNAIKYEREKIVVQVSDSHGHKTTQSFEIGKHIPFNTPPLFENSSISLTGIVGVPFVYNTDHLQHSLSYLKYQVLADDVDEDAIFVDILSGPDEAYIQRIIAYYTGITRENDPRTCEGCLHYLRWVPQEVGEYSFELGLRDARGGISESRHFTVDVAPNLPPAIVDFNPPTIAAAGYEYSYVVNVENDLLPYRFDNLDNLRVIFEQAPSNMRSELVRIGHTQKLRVYWTPTRHETGAHTVRLRVDDQVNASVPVEFVLNVITDNQPPIIAVGSMPGAEVSIPYEYQIKASDPDGDALTYSLVGAPEGMTINKTTGVIRWVPSEDYLVASAQAWIRYAVTDARGLTAEKSDAISISAFRNRAPEFVPAYRPKFAKVGVEFVHHMQAIDREDDNPILYEVRSSATGVAMDAQNGTIRWTPKATGSFWLSASATDSLGHYASSNNAFWYVQVVPITELLDGEIQISPNGAVELGGTVSLTVVTKNEATSPQVTLMVDGQPVALNALLKANITPARAGRIPVMATISDGHETITRTTAIVVRDPTDTTPPIVEFNSPSTNADITAPTDIHVTVQDEGLTNVLLAYKAADKPAGDVVNLDEFTTLYEGADEFDNEVIAQLDTTLLVNGLYHVFLQATDANNNTRARLLSLNVTGNLKVGNFSFTVEDLNIPVGNFPITVSRTYDSRVKTKNLDFGYGWSVDYKNIRLQESIEPTRGWTMDTSNTQVYQGSTGLFIARGVCTYPTTQQRVTVTLPNGDTESFTAAVKPAMSTPASLDDPDCYLSTDRHYTVYFRPINGTQSTLETSDGESLYLSDSSNGNLGNIDDSTPVNIRRYVLTTRSGFIYRLNQDFGLEQVEDPNGNTLTYGENGIVHSNGQAVVLERDAQERINAIIDPKGNRIEYRYDATGDLVAVKDSESLAANGPGSTFAYDSSHGLVDMFDARGRRLVKNIYDDEGRLIAQEDNQGNRTDFDHNLTGRQSIVTDRDRRTKVFNYDTKGNVLTEIQLASGLVYNDIIETSYTYDTNNNQLTRAVGGVEYTHTATFDASDNQLTQRDPLGNTIHYENYNPRGQEGRIVDEMGRAHDMHYNSTGQLEQIEGPEILNAEGVPVRHKASNVVNDRGLVESTTDMRGHVTTYTYYGITDPENTRAWMGQKKTESTAEGGTTTYTYDTNLNVATETRTRTRGGVVTAETLAYDYDSRNHLVKTTYPDGSSTETQFDLAGNAVREKDRYGNWMEIDYDAYNRDTETRYPDGTKETKTYTAEGLLLTHTTRNGTLTRYEYDDFGRQWKVHNDTAGTYTETRYTQQGWVQYEWDERRNKTEYTYDLAGRRLAVIRHGEEGVDVPVTRSFTYYANGELETETDALGHTTRYNINTLDQRIETVYPNLSTTRTQFDAMGARIRAHDQNSKSTRFDYDGLGRLAGVQPEVSIDGLPVPITAYTYDEVGNKLTQTDAKGNTTRWTYDYHGRVLSRTLPEGQLESFIYTDGKGCDQLAAANCASTASPRLQVHTDFNGDTITTAYDVMGQVISVTYSKDGKQEVYAYTVDGQVENITTTQGATISMVSYTYTINGQLDTETQADGTVLAYDYDAAGNRTLVSITKVGQATPTTTHYTYDGFNRLTTVVDASGTTSYGYDAVGNLKTQSYPNGLTTTYIYNSINQLTNLTTRNTSNQIVSSYSYGLDATGRRENITELNGRFTQYQYDDLYRLTNETITDAVNGNYTAAYQYDWAGNRVYETVNGVQTAYHYDDNDRLTQTGDTTYSYDGNGNTLTETLDANTKTYVWDSKNKLTSITYNGNTTRYTYNPDGIRTGKTENGATTKYVVDSNRDYAQVLEEVENNLASVQYTYGHDLINQQREGATSFYHYDGLGSTRLLSNSSGGLTDSYNYEAFGEIRNQTGSTQNDYLFTGEQYDNSLNQYYLRARYYDQGTGRFTQMDTWGGDANNSITLHKYLYGNSDPVNFTDPTGNFGLASFGTASNVRGILTALSTQNLSFAISRAVGATLQQSGRATMKTAIRTVRQCIKKKKCDLPFNLLVVGGDNSAILEHIRDAQTATTVVLTYDKNKLGNRSWYRKRGGCTPASKKPGYQCDEYPFFKTREGGKENAASVSLRWVPGRENLIVGGHFGFLAKNMKTADDFVVITSYDLPTFALPLGGGKKK